MKLQPNFRMLFFTCALALWFSGCVAKKKYEEVLSTQSRTEDALQSTRKELATTKRELNKLQDESEATQTQLQTDLLEKIERVQSLETELERSKATVKSLKAELSTKKSSLKEARNSLNSLEQELQQREARLVELESAIKARDERNRSLREKLKEALKGFAASDLTVEKRNGRVYVSLSQNLLFATGSSYVNRKGKDALGKLAEVLKKNEDIDITVEGHTDTEGEIKSNWQLSTSRANAVLFVLLENGLNPARITAAGKGEHAPIATNEAAEGRAKNRRTEIILSPKLEAIMELLESE